MDQPLGFTTFGDSCLICKLNQSLLWFEAISWAWFGPFSSTLIQFGTTSCKANHFVFSFHSSFGKCIYIVVYVDDIVIIGNDETRIWLLKEHLSQ